MWKTKFRALIKYAVKPHISEILFHDILLRYLRFLVLVCNIFVNLLGLKRSSTSNRLPNIAAISYMRPIRQFRYSNPPAERYWSAGATSYTGGLTLRLSVHPSCFPSRPRGRCNYGHPLVSPERDPVRMNIQRNVKNALRPQITRTNFYKRTVYAWGGNWDVIIKYEFGSCRPIRTTAILKNLYKL